MSKETWPLQVSTTKKVAPGNVNERKTEVKQPKVVSQGAINKVAPDSVKVVNDSYSGIDVQIITEQFPIPTSTSLIKNVAVGNVKVANANVQKTEVKPPITASQGAVKVAPGSLKVTNGSNDNINFQKITEQLSITASVDMLYEVATGNAKVAKDRRDGINEQKTELIQKKVDLKGVTKQIATESIKQYKFKENPIIDEPKHIDFDAELNMLPENLYETKYSELNLCTDKLMNETASSGKEGPFISVTSDLVNPNRTPVCKRSNSLIEGTNVEFERLRNLLLKRKTNYLKNNGNVHHRMVLMGGYTPEKFMQPFLESSYSNMKEEADWLRKYRCMLEDALAKNNPTEYNRILTCYNISKSAGIP